MKEPKFIFLVTFSLLSSLSLLKFPFFNKTTTLGLEYTGYRPLAFLLYLVTGLVCTQSACMKNKWSFFSVLYMYVLLKLNLISFKPQYWQTNSPDWFLFISSENKLREIVQDQSIFPNVIISLILITFYHHYVLIPLGENWCWSLLGLKGLSPNISMHFLHIVFHTFSMVLMRRICLMIKTFFTWLSSPLC